MITDNVSVSAGMNASWFEMSKEFRAEPRVSSAWQVHPKHRFSFG
ncbi:hypothetical protein [Anaerophaga thermohalophila]|nr:hypothetical protein [Anaerophaga thermohalophila]